MATQTASNQSTQLGISVPLLTVCLVLSLFIHLLTAGGFGSYARTHAGDDLFAPNEFTLPEMPVPPVPEDEPIRLGREDAKSASITWLGVLENPSEAEAPESKVEQAELAINAGVQDITQPTPTQTTPPVETIPESESLLEEIPEPAIEPEPVQTQDPVEQPEQTTQIEPIETEPAPEPVVEAVDTTKIDPEPQPERVEEPTPVEPAPNPPADEPAETQDQQPEPAQSNLPATQPTPTSETEQGKSGVEDDRESVASMIKRADTKNASDLNRPLSSAGLEIKPVEPRFPAAVRFTQLPRNPIVIIRFNAEGKVIFTDFIRDEEKKRVYDTGSKAVDEPLLSAIYKWRATGEPLKQLNPEDPKSFIEIPMKIIFRDENN